MIFDSDSALIGSHNYTMTSLDRNRELGIAINDEQLVSRVVAIYECDWLRAIPAEPVALVTPFHIGLAGIGMTLRAPVTEPSLSFGRMGL